MSAEIIYKEKNKELFWKYWNELADVKRMGYRYLQFFMESDLITARDRKLLYKDKSFVYLVNKKPKAGAFLPIEKGKKGFAITILGEYVNAPMVLESIFEKKIMSLIDEVAGENKVSKIMLAGDPLEFRKYNYLQKYNYLDTTILNYVVDLNRKNLLAACRNDHRQRIRKILKDKNFEVFYTDKSNPTRVFHEEYIKLHHKCAGGATRLKETFDLQFEQIKKGRAVLFGLKYKDKNVAYAYFVFNSDKGVYFSTADDPDYDKLSLYHALVYKALEYLKSKGVEYVDMEQPSSPSNQFGYYLDKKQLGIAMFKRGFGGDYLSQFRGIKYFSKKELKKDTKEFFKKYFYEKK